MNETHSHLVPPIQGTTRIVGLFGDPVIHTLSPKMHNHAFAKLGLDYVYLPFFVRPEDLGGAVDAIRRLNFAGVNVTIPHKQSVIPFLDEISPLAKAIGAVNTIVYQHGKLVGHNTDALGFLESLRKDGNFDPKDKKVVILGAGGVAYAIASALVHAGASRIMVTNRDLDFGMATALVEHVSASGGKTRIEAEKFSSPRLESELIDCDLFVSATPTGLQSDGFSIHPEKFLSGEVFVFDVVYGQTPLIAEARRIGVPCLNGLGMLIRQGAIAFSLWTGAEPPVDLMREALEAK